MDQQENLLGDHEIFVHVQRYFLSLVLPLYNSIGWANTNQSADWRQALLQPKVLRTACLYGNRECIDTARNLFHQWYLNPSQNTIQSSLRSLVYCIAIRDGTYEDFQFLWSRLGLEQDTIETSNLLFGLACTTDRSRIIWFLNQHLKDKSVIREQDLTDSIANVASTSHGYQIVWVWFQENWPKLFEKWGKTDSGLDDIIDEITNRFVTVRQLNEFQTFADSIIDKGIRIVLIIYPLYEIIN